MKKIISMFTKGLDIGKREKIFDMGVNLLSFATVCLISSVVFSVDRRFPEPNETAKFIKLVSLIPIISVSGLILITVKNTLRFTLIDLFSLLFSVYFLISLTVRGTGNPRHFLLPVALSAIYVVTRATSDRKDGLKWVALAILSVSIFELMLALKQIYGFASSNHFRYSVTGSFFNPGPFGGYLSFIFALSLSCLIKLWRTGEQALQAIIRRKFKELINIDVPLYVVSFAAIVLSFILLPATMSRSAWMAVSVVLLIAGIEAGVFRKIKIWLSTHKRLFLPLVFTVALTVMALMFGIYALKKDSASSRLFSWQISAKVIISNPVTGVGIGYFGGAFATQQANYFEANPESKYLYVADCPAYAFNEYLQIATELGLAGLTLFAAVMLLALWNVFIKPNPFQYGLVAMLIFAFTSYPFHIVPLLILLVLSIASQNSLSLRGRLSGKIFFVTLSVTTLAVWLVLRQPINNHIQAQTEWRKLQAFYRMENAVTAGYEEIHPALKHDYKFLFEYGHSLNKAGENKKSNEILLQGTKLSNDPMFHNIIGNNYLAMNEYDRAEKSYETAYNIVPSRIYPLYLLAKLYVKQGDVAKALSMCRRVIDFRPKVHSPAVADIKSEIEELIKHLTEN